MAGWIKMPLGMEIDLRPGDIVLDGDPAPLPKKGAAPPNFRPMFIVAHVYCGRTAGYIKMVLGMEVGLSPSDFVLDRNPAPSPKRRRSPPIFGRCLLRPNSCMDQDATWYGGRPRPRRNCVRWGPSSPPSKKGDGALNFQHMSIVAKRLHGSRCHLVRR